MLPFRARQPAQQIHRAWLRNDREVVDLDAPLALSAAKLGVELKLPLADSIVYATAQRVDGTVWTLDDDFDGLAGVQFHAKTAPKG